MRSNTDVMRSNRLLRARDYRESTLHFLEDQSQFLEEDDLDPYYFSCGNHTVIDWGIVLELDNFHTANQIYPLGFRCLRKEHDLELDVIVDCLCEVDAICILKDNQRTYFSELTLEERTMVLATGITYLLCF